MKYSRPTNCLLLLFLALFVLGCSGRPVEQIEKTERAMQQAKTEHAEEFATTEWKDGEKAWQDAQGFLDKEKWGDANIALLKAKTRFEKARDIAKGKRQDAIKEIQNLQKTIELRCQTLKANLEKNAAKLAKKRRDELEASCKEIEDKAATVKTKLEREEYYDSKFLAQQTLRQVWETEKDLESALGGRRKS